MSYYYYGSNIIQNLTTLETLTLTSSGFTYKNSTTTFIPWSTLTGTGSTPLNLSSANFSSIDSNNSTLNIGAVNARTINIGKTGCDINVDGTINASCFMLYSGNPGFSTCFLDNAPSNLSTQFVIGQNADQVYIGDNNKNKNIWIGRGSIFNNEIRIGGPLSTVNINSDTTNIGNSGLSATGSVNIAAGLNVTGSYAQMGSNSLPYLYLRGINLKINDNNAGYTHIGSTGYTVNIYGTTILTGTFTADTITSKGSVKVADNAGGTTNKLLLAGDDIYHCIYSTGIGGDYTNFCEYTGWNFRSTFGPAFPGTVVVSISRTGAITAASLTTTGNINVANNNSITFNGGSKMGNVDGQLRIASDDNIYFNIGSPEGGEYNSYGTTYMELNTDRLYLAGRLWANKGDSFIKAPLYINFQNDSLGESRIQFSNYGTWMYTDINGYDTHRYRFFLRNVNNFEMNYVWNNTGNFMSRFGHSTNGSIGDFAEMFEWEDGNPENENRVGYTVVVNEQGFIRKATDNPNDIIGVVTATATVTGSAAGMEYNKKYLRDDFEQTLLDSSGNPMINPNYDESIPYENRDKRKEWAPIGLYGKLIVRNGSPINPRWRLIGTRQTAKIYLA